MERRKLTKEDIDKVRDVEGFPIATDDAIIELSDAPYYTACPNPFIKDFIDEYGTPYDEDTDDYHREPFTADVSEGKHDPLYMAHSYHTKVPYKAIMRYILHYTDPGDIVFDGFCGTGMTGAAALMCGDIETCTSIGTTSNAHTGSRHAILADLSPEATFIAKNYNTEVDISAFAREANKLINQLHIACDWVYETAVPGSAAKGSINYTIWSEQYICPSCSREFSWWDAAVESTPEAMKKTPRCPHCGAVLNKAECSKALEPLYDEQSDETTMQPKAVPVRIKYEFDGKAYDKTPDANDLAILDKVRTMRIGCWYPNDLMMHKGDHWGDYWRAGYHVGITRVNHFYTKRNLYVIATCHELIMRVKDNQIKSLLLFWLSSIYSRSHKLNRYMPSHHRHVGPLSGTLYIPALQAEINIINLLEDKLKSVMTLGRIKGFSLVSTQSSTDLCNIPNNSIDYVFVDPPFGDNLHYSELNFIQESWLRCFTNNADEAIVNVTQHKGVNEYQELLSKCFLEFYRILKPNRWITVEFHNSKNAIWNAIQQAIQRAGFVIADVRTLDKQKGTTKQLSYTMAVKQDLVISAYKPSNRFCSSILQQEVGEDSAWSFINQHLEKLPIVIVHDGRIEPIAERQAYLLFDRMVAYHVTQGIPVPLDATDFYRGLDERFIKRDDMYFLPDQVTEYDTARMKMKVESVQTAFLVTNEKTAIGWLYQLLGQTPMTYQEIQLSSTAI